MKLLYLNQTEHKVDKAIFEWVLERVPKYERRAKHEDVELLITDNATIQELNRQYRDKDKPTDVLSFGFEDPVHLGQIVISIERAAEQAKEIGNTLEDELKFLFCHGVLHNLGYDHMTPKEEKEMMGLAYRILGRTNQ
jgi:probable rRNA maturation factor